MDKLKGYATVESSHGSLIINKEGYVLPALSFYDNDTLLPIRRFDIWEYCRYYKLQEMPDSVDILEIGFWFDNFMYEKPVKTFRESRGVYND